MARKDVVIRNMSEEDVSSVIYLAAKVFATKEPMCRHLNIAIEEMVPFCREFVAEVVPFSCVAEDKSTSKMVGFRLCDPVKDDGDDAMALDGKMRIVFAVLNELEKRWLQQSSDSKTTGKTLKLLMMGVEEEYEGLGLATRMVSFTLERAKDSGFKKVVVQASAAATQHIFIQKYGFKQISAIKYADFEYEGCRPFETLQVPSTCVILEKEL